MWKIFYFSFELGKLYFCMKSKHTLVTSYIITSTTHRCLQILTSSLEFFSSPSGRNWKVLIVKRRVWPWGEGGRGSNSTVFCGAGSKGLGHLGSDIRCSSQLESRTKRTGNIFLSSSTCENNLNFYDLYGEFFFSCFSLDKCFDADPL